MTSQPPTDTSPDIGDEEPIDASMPPDVSGDSIPRTRWRSTITVIAVLALAAVVAGALLFNNRTDQSRDHAAPTQGLACPYLQQAADAYERGDRTAFDSAVAQALKVAQDTLQTSGQAFGKPERIALELGLGQPNDPTPLLDRARDLCSMSVQPSPS
jgi:hypothetical protein